MYIHTYILTYIHTYIRTWKEGKMADVVSEDIQAALNKIMTTTDQSGNIKKDLKNIIFETVSDLRNLLTEIIGIIEEKSRHILLNETGMNKVKLELAACRREVAKDRNLPYGKWNHQDPSADSCCHRMTEH